MKLYKMLLENGKCEFKRTSRMTEEQWLKVRQTGIGGSDAGAIMGMNQYSTPLSVYLQKTTEVESQAKTTNESIQWGKMAEAAIREGIAKDLNMTIEAVPGMFTSTENSFMNANLDGIAYTENPKEVNGTVVQGLGGVEIKTATERNKEFSDDEIPDSYYCQVQHYMYVTGLQWFILAVLIGKVEGKVYVVPRNDDFIKRLVEKESSFWFDNVEKGEMPPPTGNERESEALNLLINSAASEVELPDEFETKCFEYKELDAQIKMLKQRQETIKEEIKIAIASTPGEGTDNNKIVAKSGSAKITWQKQVTKRICTDDLKKAGLFDMYAKNSESLVMRISVKDI